LVASVLFITSLFLGLRHDDAYITFVYARHLASGEGMVFNLGERVLGATSPLHILLLALVHLLAGDVLPEAAIVLGAVGLSLQALLLYSMTRGFSRVLAVMLGLAVAAGIADSPTWLALETNLFAALVLAVLYAHQLGRPVLTGACLGLAFLCRYDAVLLIPLLVLESRLAKRGHPWRELLASFVVALPWLVTATIYFGSFLPQSFIAKRGISGPGLYLGHYVNLAASQPLLNLFPGLPPSLALGMGLACWAAGFVLIALHLPELRAFVLFTLLLLGAYAVIGPPPVQHWHMYPMFLASSILVLVGSMGWLLLGLGRWMADPGSTVRSTWLALCPGLVIFVLAIEHTAVFFAAVEHDFWLGYRHQRYESIARWISTHVQPGPAFMAAEVGTLGYLTRARMLDPYGLINDTNEYPATRTPSALLRLARQFGPGLLLAESAADARWIESRTPLRIVRMFPAMPTPTVLLTLPGLLRHPPDSRSR
jgi:hypothetical protein